MLDINFIRENAEKVKKATKDKGFDESIIERLLKVDEERRKILQEVETLRGKRNKFTKDDIEEGKKLKVELKEKEESLNKFEKDYHGLLNQIPNPPADDVKTGKDDSENEVIRTEGKPTKFDFEPKDHLALGQALNIIDTEAAAKVSGSRFGYITGDAALLEFALIQFAMETLIKEGFIPIVPPVLMKVPVFKKLGYSEHLGNENYYYVLGDPEKKNKGDEEEGYYLVGTSEHSVVPYYMDHTFKSSDLPKRFVSFSTCFRREAGTYGKDTRGILRVHQFDKVEMVSFTKPEDSNKEHEFLLSLEGKLLKALEIPYQVVKMCSRDLGAPAARKYDLEGWIPSENKYRELTSTSTCTDFQSRRLNIKYRDGDKTEYVHTLNGTAFAIGRTIIAILENYQQKDGSVLIPKVLQKWMGKEKISV
jgi:seryl-tRNA synthetase